MSTQLENEILSESGFSNCHRNRTNTKPQNDTEAYNGSDQDSARSKEVVQRDDRKKKEGPGGE